MSHWEQEKKKGKEEGKKKKEEDGKRRAGCDGVWAEKSGNPFCRAPFSLLFDVRKRRKGGKKVRVWDTPKKYSEYVPNCSRSAKGREKKGEGGRASLRKGKKRIAGPFSPVEPKKGRKKRGRRTLTQVESCGVGKKKKSSKPCTVDHTYYFKLSR